MFWSIAPLSIFVASRDNISVEEEQPKEKDNNMTVAHAVSSKAGLRRSKRVAGMLQKKGGGEGRRLQGDGETKLEVEEAWKLGSREVSMRKSEDEKEKLDELMNLGH